MRIMIIAWSLLFAAGSAHAGIWETLAGRWTGSGEVRGMPAAIELEFRPALDGRGHHLRFLNRMTMPDGKAWAFRAEAFYLCDQTGVCRGHWYDSRGMTLPLTARSRDGSLVVEWGDEASERGRTTYRKNDGKLAITDEVQGKDGDWKVFGETTSTRARGASMP